jgi:hypothetical protein
MAMGVWTLRKLQPNSHHSPFFSRSMRHMLCFSFLFLFYSVSFLSFPFTPQPYSAGNTILIGITSRHCVGYNIGCSTPFLWCLVSPTLFATGLNYILRGIMPRSHQTFRPVPIVRLLGIMFTIRCWPTVFHIITTGDANRWC